MRIIILLLALFVVSCTMYEGLSMKPHKTSVTTTYGQDEVDKANDSKDDKGFNADNSKTGVFMAGIGTSKEDKRRKRRSLPHEKKLQADKARAKKRLKKVKNK